MKSFPFYSQLNRMDCGPTCLKMICKYYGKNISLEKLRDSSQYSKDGVSLLGISYAAENVGLKSLGIQVNFETLFVSAPLPAILHWKQSHFVVLPPQKKKSRKIEIADPAAGLISVSKTEFLENWANNKQPSGTSTGIALLLETTPYFFEQENDTDHKVGWHLLFRYLKKYKQYFTQVFIALLVGSFIQLIFPFLTQSIVDTGIHTQNLQYISIILLGQLVLFFSRTVIEFIRSRLLLHISARINLSILSDFWMKLMKLPISFFDTKRTGDILQRIGDHSRVESFLTNYALSTLFAVINLAIFSIVLLFYSQKIFFIFTFSAILYYLWIRLFLKYRRKIDHKRFQIASSENSTTMQLIHGMQEIKLNNAENLKRWQWEKIQSSLFSLSFKRLSINQYQQAGAFFINEGKNIFITFLVAQMVINGDLTLGAMLAIQYIIGQLNSPIEQLIGFAQASQDARLSLERLNEIHQLTEEESSENEYRHEIPADKSIHITNLSFKYPGTANQPVLNDINISIPAGKITAIVGTSGSGKTTLLKILLRFYEDYTGKIQIGNTSLKNISPRYWRKHCGCVMQEGFIFSDTISRNIAVSDENTDHERLINACRIANILPFIESLPNAFNTRIGAEGNGISAGQKQRILIARAVYKNPHYIFLDEATNSLDANNEKEILENMSTFLKGKTVLIVAHRLSTVKNADNIIVFHESNIVESGTHDELSKKKGKYFELVKNQLELGK